MPDINTQAFWDSMDAGMWDDVSGLAIQIVLAGIEGGSTALPDDAQPFINFDDLYNKVLEFARKYRLDWIRNITEVTRKKTIKAIGDWIRSGSPLSTLEQVLEPLFGEMRAKRIATTEVTRLFAHGNQMAWEATGFVNSMKWMTAEDEKVCPICKPLDGTLIGIGDLDALPPAHVNCRCWVQPVVDDDAFSRKLDEILGL